MKKIFFDKTRLASFLLALGLLSTSTLSLATVFNASALSEEENDKASSKLWSTPSDSSSIYCDAGSAAFFTAICSKEPSAPLATNPEERYIDITMHAGDYGHFADGDPKEHTNTYFYTDSFNDYTEPVSDRSDYVFAGWSTNPEATEVDIDVIGMRASQIGSDIYAVWSNKAYVYYHIYNGAWQGPEDEIYQHVLMEYGAGENFIPLSPEPYPIQHVYDFAGWSTQPYGRGDHYTSETPITKLMTEVYSEWHYNPDYIEDELTLNEEVDVAVGVSIPVYKFTPEETATYEIYTDGIESGDDEAYQGMIRLQDVYDRNLKMEQSIDPTVGWGDVHLYYEMEAGETYYVRFAEGEGHFLRFSAGVRKAEMIAVTFDANHGDDAWFDGDHSVKQKQVNIPSGDDIATFYVDGHETSDDIAFTLWTSESDPDSEDIHNHLIVTEPMTAYAQYSEMIVFELDYNGGYDPFDSTKTSDTERYLPWINFDSKIDPKIDNPHLKFAGWSTNPDATEPDPEIFEGKISASALYELIQGQTLYAVYSEPVSVTFNTIGGAYMVDDPSITTYTSSLGNGHAFYGMSVMHYHPNVKHVGWVDQNDNFIQETSQSDGTYRVVGDTVYTSVLNYEMLAIGNGGYFPYGGIGGAGIKIFQIPYNGWASKFSYEDALKVLGAPVSYDETMHFVGFATNPDAIEPDIIDGETYLEDLDTIYAIWAENEDEPEDDSEESESEEDVPLVPDTGSNIGATEAGASAVIACIGLASVLALIGFISFRKRKN